AEAHGKGTGVECGSELLELRRKQTLQANMQQRSKTSDRAVLAGLNRRNRVDTLIPWTAMDGFMGARQGFPPSLLLDDLGLGKLGLKPSLRLLIPSEM